MEVRVSSIRSVCLSVVLVLGFLVAAGDGSSAAPEATCTANGTALTITAADNKFDKDCLAVPADQAFTIEFDNQDSGIPHNVSLYDTANGNKELYKGEIIDGPKKITYSVPAQAAGKYEFICDPHADFMKGTFIVG